MSDSMAIPVMANLTSCEHEATTRVVIGETEAALKCNTCGAILRDPFEHGTCAKEGCERPAIFEGGYCTTDVLLQKPASANVRPAGDPKVWSPVEYARRKKQRRIAAASARRNRR